MCKYWYLFLAVIVFGCENSINNSGSNNESLKIGSISENNFIKLSDDPVIRKGEAYLHKLADEIEGFGGLYLDREGNMHLSIKSKDPEALDKNQMKTKISKTLNKVNMRPLLIGKADFTFKYLVDVRDKIYSQFDDLEITFLDLAEDQNRVVVGLLSDDKSAFFDFINSQGIAPNSIIVKRMEATQPAHKIERKPLIFRSNLESAYKEMTSSTLTTYNRPIVGGYRVRGTKTINSQLYGTSCTTGFNAKWNGKNVFITNSHCTENANWPSSALWSVDAYIDFNIPGEYEDSSQIGKEVFDPSDTSSYCPWNHECRDSDSAIIEYENINSSDIGFARIIKTTYRGTNWTNGSTTLLSNYEDFRVIDQDKTILLNMPLNKVGITTGWTHGYVSNTCVVDNNFWGSNKDLRCSYFVSGMKAFYGDSGSPVFYDNTTPSGDVQLVGLLYGTRTSEQKAAFSPIFGIEHDLGSFDATDPPISVDITGTGLVQNTGNYTWYSNVSEQDGGVTYQWQIKWEGSSSYTNLGTGSSQSVTVTNETNFTLKLTVTDSSDSAVDTFPVTVTFESCDPTNPFCTG